MSFRRKESFRFVFNEPIEAKFKVFVNGKQLSDKSYPCKILDISPRGIKMYTDVELQLDFKQNIQFETYFVLNITNIQAIGDIIWSKPYSKGKQYGLFFKEQSDIDDLIINEMKIRRRKEVLGNK